MSFVTVNRAKQFPESIHVTNWYNEGHRSASQDDNMSCKSAWGSFNKNITFIFAKEKDTRIIQQT